MDMQKYFAEQLNVQQVNKINFNFDLFEASDDLKHDIEKLLKGDKKAVELKKLAIRNRENVHDYLDHIYYSYDKEIEKLSKKHRVDYDKIAQTFLEV